MSSPTFFKHAIFGIAICCAIGCTHDPEPTPDEDVYLGGTTSIEGGFVNIFQQPAPNLTAEELDLHREADKAFGDIFVTAPATIQGGLGPVFNQNACESCHTSNGRSPFPANSQELRGLLFRLSLSGSGTHGEPIAVPNFGGQLQTKATFGKQPEASVTWEEITDIKHYLDGTSIVLHRYHFSLVNPYLPLPSDVLVSPRMASPVIGLGLLEAIEETDIRQLSDPNDADQDGISGKVNEVWDEASQSITLGRFGWKASQPTLYQQTAAAYRNDMGITNVLFPTESCAGQSQANSTDTDDPEIDIATLEAATFYTQSLAVPTRRNWEEEEVKLGKQLFMDIQCSTCHHPKFITGQHPKYPFLSQQTIFPYTDMLLHDMGDDLSDHRPDFMATGNEWRTPPLWGIGLTEIVGNHTRFLHDGRAHSLEEAIMWHGGEAATSKEAFSQLSKEDRNAIIAFLKSL